MEKIKDITLAFHCPLGDDLVKSEKAFHCKHCSTDVRDFSNRRKFNLEMEIENSEEPACGIFKKSQLSEQFLKFAAATLLITASVTITALGQEIKTDSVIADDSISANEDQIFGMFVETAAAPVGGYQKFFEALSKELRYPAGLTTIGKCFVEFYIDTTGQATDYKILRSFDSAVDQEVLRAMTALHYPWTPARLRNKPVRSRFVIPVAFDPIKK